MAEQLVFDLPARRALGRGDFYVSEANRSAADAIAAWGDWPNRKLALVGPRGSGKTHLAHVWAAESGAHVADARALASADIPALASGPVAVEDADMLSGKDAEEALLHLHNLVLSEGGALLLTASSPPSRWRLSLPDLASRMQGVTVAWLSAPDDALLSAVIVKLFADRQIAVRPAAIAYLVRRIERSFAAAGDIVEALDRAALAGHAPVTRALAAAVLDKSRDCAR